jgi:hypothetical protein
MHRGSEEKAKKMTSQLQQLGCTKKLLDAFLQARFPLVGFSKTDLAQHLAFCRRAVGTHLLTSPARLSKPFLVVVIVVVPITTGVPTMIVLVPPAMISRIAAFPLFMQFVSPVLGLAALGAMVLNGLVELVVNFREALVTVVCTHEWSSGGEGEKSYEHSGCERNLAIERNESH